ncbi:MAG: hypothetical protein ACO26X_04870, partial [Candidatus Fonsibacter ubiquis]
KKYDWNKISDDEKERIVKDLALSKSAQKKLKRLGRKIAAKEIKAEEKREIMSKVEPKKELLSELKGKVRRKSSAKMEAESIPPEMEEKAKELERVDIELPRVNWNNKQDASDAQSLVSELKKLDVRSKQGKQKLEEIYKKTTGKNYPKGIKYGQVKVLYMNSLMPPE